MKRIQYNEYGDNSVLEMADVSIPEPQPNEILIKTSAVSVNPMDWKVRDGLMKEMLDLPFPITPGLDIAGVVESVGDDVTDFKAGDRVISYVASYQGTYAEYAVTEAKWATKLPDEIDFKTGAALPLAGLTALEALDALNLMDGQRLLIQGGAGAVGTFTAQFAKARGIKVYITASPDHDDFLQQVGVDGVFDYHNIHAFDGVEPFDAVLDLVGGDSLDHAYELVKKGGVLVSTAQMPDDDEANNFGITAKFNKTEPNQKALTEIMAAVRDRKVKTFINEQFDFELEAVQKALASSQGGHVSGKIIINIAE